MGEKAIAGRAPHDSGRTHIALILAIAVIFRVIALLIFAPGNLQPSITLFGFENIAIAFSIHHGHGYSSPFFIPSGPTALLTPVYPLLIAGVMHLFGLGRSAELVLMCINLALSVLTVLAVIVAAHRYFGKRVANLAGFIAAIAPPMFFAPLWIWDTCLSALLLSVVFAIAPSLSWKRWSSIGTGGLCALATLTNPALLPSLIAIFAWSAWRARVVPWLAIVTFLVAFSPWPIRNALTMHAFIPLRSSFGYELWAGNHPGGDGNLPLHSGPMHEHSESQSLTQEGELKYIRTKKLLAIEFISSHPMEFAKLTARRIFRFWAGTARSPFPISYFLPVAGLLGLIVLRQRRLVILFALPLGLFPLPYYITHADARYRFVLDPLLAILAGYAGESFLAWCSRKPVPSPILATSVH